MVKKTNKLKFNKNGTVDILAGEYNLKETFSILKFFKQLFCWHKYKSIGIIGFSDGEFGHKKKIKGLRVQLSICLKCNKMKSEIIK